MAAFIAAPEAEPPPAAAVAEAIIHHHERFTQHILPNEVGARAAVATLFAVSWYNALELLVLIFIVFKRFRGLYFWSLLVATLLGVVPYSIGFLIKFFVIVQSPYCSLVLLTIGWWCMITGQSLVLYSRLHLISPNDRVLRWVLVMIIVDAVVLHIPTTTFTFCSNTVHARQYPHHACYNGYKVMEKLQMTGFCLQEAILSALYIWETARLLLDAAPGPRSHRKLTYQLLSINLLFILMDIGLLVAIFMDLYVWEITVKATIYSIKLKLEFAVLGKLIDIVANGTSTSLKLSNIDANSVPDFVDPTKLPSQTCRPPIPDAHLATFQSLPWVDVSDLTEGPGHHSGYEDEDPEPYGGPDLSFNSFHQIHPHQQQELLHQRRVSDLISLRAALNADSLLAVPAGNYYGPPLSSLPQSTSSSPPPPPPPGHSATFLPLSPHMHSWSDVNSDSNGNGDGDGGGAHAGLMRVPSEPVAPPTAVQGLLACQDRGDSTFAEWPS